MLGGFSPSRASFDSTILPVAGRWSAEINFALRVVYRICTPYRKVEYRISIFASQQLSTQPTPAFLTMNFSRIGKVRFAKSFLTRVSCKTVSTNC